jgi:hypothetical protein
MVDGARDVQTFGSHAGIEHTDFFKKIRSDLVVSLYNQPEIWPKFGYDIGIEPAHALAQHRLHGRVGGGLAVPRLDRRDVVDVGEEIVRVDVATRCPTPRSAGRPTGSGCSPASSTPTSSRRSAPVDGARDVQTFGSQSMSLKPRSM